MKKISGVDGIRPSRSRALTTAWAVLLVLSMAVFLASCGESEAADTDTQAYDYGSYAEWDADGDDELAEKEFYGGVYESWDEDDNNVVDENEWSKQTS